MLRSRSLNCHVCTTSIRTASSLGYRLSIPAQCVGMNYPLTYRLVSLMTFPNQSSPLLHEIFPLFFLSSLINLETPSQMSVYPALQYTSTSEQISQQVAIPRPTHVPVSTVATSATPQPLAIASPLPHAPLRSSIPPSSSSSTTSNLPSSSTTSNLPSTHEDEPSSSGTKRGGTPTTDEQASKKTKVEEKEKEKEKEKETETEESGMKRSSEEQESSKKKVEEKEESEVDRRRRRQGGRNEFGGLKKGFLL